MEDLQKIMTGFVLERMDYFLERELKETIKTCETLKKDSDCFDIYRVGTMGLSRTLEGFIDGITFFSTTIDYVELRKKQNRIMERYTHRFFEYMKGRNNDKN